VGTSKKSIEEAVNAAVKRAHKMILNLPWFEIDARVIQLVPTMSLDVAGSVLNKQNPAEAGFCQFIC
jgi:flavin-binding protein dodecin